MLELVSEGPECCLCNNVALDYLKIDKKGVGSVYKPVCLNHLCGITDWRDINTLLSLMNIKGSVIPRSMIKYPKELPSLNG